MNKLTDRIRKRLAATGKTARGASLEAGLSDAFIRNILTGKARSPSADNLAKLARTLQTTESWLLRGEGQEASQPGGQTLPPIARAKIRSSMPPSRVDRETPERIYELKRAGGEGGKGSSSLDDSWSLPASYLQYELEARSADLFIIAIVGDAMLPTLLPGDRVIVDRSQAKPSDGIFLIAAGDDVAVKRLEVVSGSLPLRIRIKSDNPVHGMDEIPASHLKVIGRAVCRITRL